jgi:hypothetical protein
MKSRRYLNVGPLHDAKPGEFFDRLVGDYYTEHKLGQREEAEIIVPFAIVDPYPTVGIPTDGIP